MKSYLSIPTVRTNKPQSTHKRVANSKKRFSGSTLQVLKRIEEFRGRKWLRERRKARFAMRQSAEPMQNRVLEGSHNV